MKVDKEEFVLNGDEANLLKEATSQGRRGIVWFRDFAISIPHISYIVKRKSGAPDPDPINQKLLKELEDING